MPGTHTQINSSKAGSLKTGHQGPPSRSKVSSRAFLRMVETHSASLKSSPPIPRQMAEKGVRSRGCGLSPLPWVRDLLGRDPVSQ